MKLVDSVFSGVKWSSFSQVCRQGMQVVTTVILSRIISPGDFGLVGMAMAVIGLVSLFHDMWTSSAVIRSKAASETYLSSIFWANMVFGLLATALLFMLAPHIAGFYREQKVGPLLKWLSFTFFISGFSMPQHAAMARDLAFDKLAKIDIFSMMFGSLVGIGSALMGFGPWSLVHQAVSMLAASAILLWLSSPWRPKAVCAWADVKAAYCFIPRLTDYQFMYYFMTILCSLMIGKFLGARQLGYYSLAYRIILCPIQTISNVIGRVIMPVHSLMRDDNERFRRVFLQAAGSIALVIFPMMFGLLALARPVVTVFLGPKWEPAVIIIRIFCLAGLLQPIESAVGAIYQLKARTDLLPRFWASSVVIIISVSAGLHWGIAGVAAAYAASSFLLACPGFATSLKLIDMPVRGILRPLSGPFTGGLIMFIVLIALLALFPEGTPGILVLGILVPAGAAVYLASIWTTDGKEIRRILEMAGIKV